MAVADVVFDDDSVGAIGVGGDMDELPVLEVLSTTVVIGLHSECARHPNANLRSW